MKYKEFIANAAIQIMAHQCESFNESSFVKTDKNDNVIGASDKVQQAASNSVIAAKALADELEDDFCFGDADLEDNHKMTDYEDFFDAYKNDEE